MSPLPNTLPQAASAYPKAGDKRPSGEGPNEALGLSWDSMLKLTKVKTELLMDYGMYLFVEKGIRGGTSQCSNRYARANNKYLPNSEPSKPHNFLLYFDVNNLYGWAMSQSLPLNDFLDIDNINEKGGKGYILEVYLKISGILTG
ncbi:uncharacterized protein TNCV_4390171 [Trichonephila clavipes]|nr:uncharacterized protein TNCV_4390171 [Trichonephila clavipes]